MSTIAEYIVTLKSFDDLDQFYIDMETVGGTTEIPERAVSVYRRRPISRNTHYCLTIDEANRLMQDPRVEGVELAELLLNSITPLWTQTGNFEKYALSSTGKNWGLYRCINGQQVPNWGWEGVTAINNSVTSGLSGKNVDVLIVDGHFDPAHPEFSVNPDGTGGSRVVQLDWYTLNSVAASVDDDNATLLSGTYLYTPYHYGIGEVADENNHGCHVAGITAGNSNGWARSATIYNINPYQNIQRTMSVLTMWDYIRAFHRTKSKNPATGTRNPTICNCSYGSSITFPTTGQSGSITKTNYRGTILGDGTTPLNAGQLHASGIYSGVVPYFSTSIAADIQQAIDDGIIVVAAAGNESSLIDTVGGLDYNNTFEATYFGIPSTWYSNRGTTPSAASNVICVGSINNSVIEQKASYSNTGPRISIFAPGTKITSSINNSYTTWGAINDRRNNTYFITSISGTSMASPQVCGILACVLELYPRMTQADALAYIQKYAKQGQITSTSGGVGDVTDILNAGNRYLYFNQERGSINTVFPKVNNFLRPSSGLLFPRTSRNIRFK